MTTVEEIKADNPKITFYLIGEYILSSLKMAKSKKSGVYESEVLKDIDSVPTPFRDYKSAIKYFDPKYCSAAFFATSGAATTSLSKIPFLEEPKLSEYFPISSLKKLISASSFSLFSSGRFLLL